MRILIVTDSYPPELRSASLLMKELAVALKDLGHDIIVITSYPQHNLAVSQKSSSFSLDSYEDGVRVLRVKVLPHHNVNFIFRGIAQLFLPYLFYSALKKKVDKIDVVIVHSPPLPLTIAAIKVKKYYGAKFLLNLHDFFPQNAVDLGILNIKSLIKFFEVMERQADKEADIIITPSHEHELFLEKNRDVNLKKIRVIPHWIDVRPFKEAKRTGAFRKKFGLEGKFIFCFGGVLGPSQGLDLIIRLAERLKDNKDIVFLFVGDGREKEDLIRMTKELSLNNVIFKSWVSKEEYPFLLKDVDVGFFSLTSKNTTPALPAKLIGYMASSLPVVAFLHKESEGHKIIRESGCGFSALYDDEDAALDIVLRIYKERDRLREYGAKGLAYAESHFTSKICAAQWEKLF